MGIYTKLSEEKYQELEKQYIKHCEAPEEKDYELFLDSVSAATIGIGFNVYNNPEWITILLLCKFGDLKPLEQLDTYYSNPIYYGSGKYDKFLKKYSRTIISKEESRQKITVRSVNKILQLILAHKNKYNVTAGKKFPKMEELNQQVQNLIDEYNKEDGVEKIPVSNFSFSLSSEEAEAIYHAGKLKYLNIIDKYLAGSGKIFNAEQIKNTNLFISLLSLSYQQGSLKLLNNIFYPGIEKSRFLIWFALRYKMAVLSDKSLRRLHDSVIFGLLEPRKDDAAQADIPAVINDIFAYLNYPQNKDSYTSYLDYMKNLPENNIDEIAKDDNTVCFHKGNEYKIIFDSLLKIDSIKNYFIDTSFLENKFIDNIIDFAPYDTIFSIFTQLIKESFGEELKAKKGSEELFLLENIYVVECINKEKFISLMELKYSSLQEKCNVFLFLNSTLDIVNDISYLQSKCPNVHFTIGIHAGYTYSFRLDDKSSAQTNIMLYSIKEGKYIPELLKDTFKAENISSEESQDEKNILLFSAEENNNLSGRLSNNANIFHITHQSAEKIISKIKLYNLISDKYEGNIQVNMQDKEYEVSAAKSSGEFNVDITLSILDEALNDEEINDKPYYMLVNSTGEIFESKVSNGKASFSYNPAEARSNQKVLFSFNKTDLLCKKSANGKCLDYAWINKTAMENKKLERTFTINKEDVPQYSITGVELDNIEEIASSNLDALLNIEYRFKAYSDIEDKSKIKWGYMLLNNSELKSLSNITVLKPSVKLYEKFHQLTETGDMISVIPNKILSKDEIKLLKNDNYALIPIPYFNIHYIDIRNFNNNINGIKIVNETIESDIISLNFYIVVDNIGKNGFLVRYTYKTVEDAIKYHRHGELVGIKADLKVFPEKYGLYAVSPEAGNSIVSHVRGSTKNSQYVSASTLSDGAERFNVNNGSKKLSIDINKLKQSGAVLISTDEISEAFSNDNKALMSKKKVNIHQVIRNNEARFKAIQDQEVLIKGADRKSSQFIFTPDDLSKVKISQTFGKTLLPLAYILTTVNLINAGIDSAEKQSIKPIAEEVAEQAAGWGGAFAGMWLGSKIGSLTGSIIGTPGVGTVIGGIVGSIAGGYAGYFGISNFFEDDSDED